MCYSKKKMKCLKIWLYNPPKVLKQIMGRYPLNHFYLQVYVVGCADFTVIIVIILFCIDFTTNNVK